MDDGAIDRNDAAHRAFLDYLFGTAVKSDSRFPPRDGAVGGHMPNGLARPPLFPFRRHKALAEPP